MFSCTGDVKTKEHKGGPPKLLGEVKNGVYYLLPQGFIQGEGGLLQSSKHILRWIRTSNGSISKTSFSRSRLVTVVYQEINCHSILMTKVQFYVAKML